MVMIFAPDIFQATIDEAKKTTWKDIFPVIKTAGLIAGGLMLLGTGNILFIGGAIYFYRSYMMNPQPAATATK